MIWLLVAAVVVLAVALAQDRWRIRRRLRKPAPPLVLVEVVDDPRDLVRALRKAKRDSERFGGSIL